MNPTSPSIANNHYHNTKYRGDIDGLRALAILPVVIFHAFPESLSGGFVGVDIFFVISGFLISTIIFRELKQGNFSFLGFYARRIRRLFPALCLVLSSTLIFGWFALDSDEYKMLGKHVAAGAGFVQNFVLWGELGYFDINSELKPLLHLWSLAIEEQFYLLFPLTVWLAWRFGVNLLTLVLLIAIGSLALNLYWIRIDPVGTFYFPHTRIWELMAGAILASISVNSTSHSQQVEIDNQRTSTDDAAHHFNSSNVSIPSYTVFSRSSLSCIGLGLIVISAFIFDKNHNFPGWRAIVPVLGAVLIIHADQHAFINRHILSNKLVIFVGLISYPLYLWHWPLISFAKIIESEPLSVSLRVTLVAISFILATLTYILIEKPIRSGNFQRFWAVTLAIFMFIVGTTGFMAHKRELTSKQGVDVQELKMWDEQRPIREKYCAEIFPEWNDRRDSFKCVFLENRRPEITVIGDSHARRIFYGISHYIGNQHNVALFANGCSMPFYDLSVGISKKLRKPDYHYFRAKLINKALDFSINDPSVKLILLTTSACWNNIVDIKNLHEKNASRIVESKMRITFEKLSQSGKQVIYVLDNPILNFDPKSCITRPFRINSDQGSCKMKREIFDKQRKQYFQIANRVLSDYPNIKVFNLASKLCDSESCYSVIDNKLLYRDKSHLNYDGSKYVTQFMLPLIEESLLESN